MRLIFATNNHHKIRELRSVIPQHFSIITLKEAGIDIDIPEPYDTLEDNAKEKARVIFAQTDTNCFSEDSGLEIAALNGSPGVKSARYAGEGRSAKDNINKLLLHLEGEQNRQAQFRTVICLKLNTTEKLFEGTCTGVIVNKPKGTDGFGYDPVFVPDGANKTFAEMNLDEKNSFSHRRKAVDKLVAFLNNQDLNKQY